MSKKGTLLNFNTMSRSSFDNNELKYSVLKFSYNSVTPKHEILICDDIFNRMLNFHSCKSMGTNFIAIQSFSRKIMTFFRSNSFCSNNIQEIEFLKYWKTTIFFVTKLFSVITVKHMTYSCRIIYSFQSVQL